MLLNVIITCYWRHVKPGLIGACRCQVNGFRMKLFCQDGLGKIRPFGETRAANQSAARLRADQAHRLLIGRDARRGGVALIVDDIQAGER